jgi:hypothetical protein
VDQLELKKVNLEQESIGKKRVGDMSEENRKRRKVVEEPASCKQAQRKETRGFVKDSKCLALDFHYDFEDSRYSGGSDYGSPLRSVTASPLRAGIDSPLRLGTESPLYSSISSPAHVSQDQEAENGADSDDPDDIWKNTDDILSKLEASLSNFTKKTNIAPSKLAIETKTSPTKTKPQRRSRSKKKEEARQSPTNPESGKENADSNDPDEAVKYLDQETKTPSSQLKDKLLLKAEKSNITAENQTPPGSKRKRIANTKYINEEFVDSSSPRRSKNNTLTSSQSPQRNKTIAQKTVVAQKADSVNMKLKAINSTISQDKTLKTVQSKIETTKTFKTSQNERKRSLKEEFVVNNKKSRVTSASGDKEIQKKAKIGISAKKNNLPLVSKVDQNQEESKLKTRRDALHENPFYSPNSAVEAKSSSTKETVKSSPVNPKIPKGKKSIILIEPAVKDPEALLKKANVKSAKGNSGVKGEGPMSQAHMAEMLRQKYGAAQVVAPKTNAKKTAKKQNQTESKTPAPNGKLKRESEKVPVVSKSTPIGFKTYPITITG